MACPPPLLDESVLDNIVSRAVELDPSLRTVFLASLGSQLHASATRVLFRTLSLPDDSRIFAQQARTNLSSLLANPARYAPNVRRIVVTDPTVPDDGALEPIVAEALVFLLEVCSGLEELLWESVVFPPDGICESISAYNPRLTRISLSHPPLSPRNNLKWDALSLPLLATVPLTSMRISRLSQHGARAFCQLLDSFGAASQLQSLAIDFVWLDDSLCEKIVVAGRKLRELTLSTNGTKLSERGVCAILEGCELLEEIVLDEVQGRLSKSLWTKPVSFPPALKTIRVVISESGPHHSWARDHLESIHAVLSLPSLSTLDITRREPLPTIHCDVPIYDGPIDDTAALKPVSAAFMDQVKEKSELTTLRCDFWSFTPAELKQILECFPKLEHLLLCIDGPFAKLVTLTSNLSNLRELCVSILPEHATGKPPTPLVPTTNPQTSLPTPSESPVLKSKAALPQLPDLDQLQTQDPSMPLLRDVKRFMRKCPRLELLAWCGKNGRGSWVMTRPFSKSTSAAVEYQPPRIEDEVWEAVKREQSIQDAMKRGWGGFTEIERSGSTWTGATAEAYAIQRLAAEKEKEEATSPVERTKPRDPTKRTRLSSVSTSATGVSPETSPVQQQTPLTPPMSERGSSEEPIISRTRSVSEPRPKQQNRQRTPSASTSGGRGKQQQRERGASNSTRGGSSTTKKTAANGKASTSRETHKSERGGRNNASRRQTAA
uniref:Uncharacterized protein n=1 Tax=Mycena chlorophos TaxID=658473 RepID=A0ABQ0M355_MYCCL|nr:predicted protein [Mycena chlorophos]